MELYQLRSFLTVAEQGNLTRAAEALHVSQPAVSAQIKALEDELDILLFQRRPSGMRVTPAGSQLLVEAGRVLAAARQLRLRASELRGTVQGRARIGSLYDPEFIRLGQFTNALVERYPLLELELQHEVSGEALQHVLQGALDGSYYFGDLEDAPVQSLALRNFSYRVTAPAAWYDLVRMADWREIAAQPWIVPPAISSHHRLAHQLFRDRGSVPGRILESDNDAVIASLVASGVGIALMREETAIARQKAGDVCIWGTARVSTTLWFIYCQEREADPVIRALLNVLRVTWNLGRA